MSATNKIDLIFTAIDRATGTINNIDQGINKMKNSSSAFSTAMNGALMGAGMAAFNTAIAAVGASIDFMTDKINEAADRQTEAIGNAGGLAVAIQQPFADAQKQIDLLNESVNKNLAALPGATEAYKALAGSIIDNLVPAAEDLNGVLDPNKLREVTLELTRSFGLIGSGQGVGQTDITKALQRAFNGASFGELSNLQLFESGVGAKVLEEIKAKTLAAGASDLKDLSEKARIEIINAAGQKFITPEMIDAYQKSFSGAVEGINTILFNFTDFADKLETRGGKTVLDAAGEVINEIMNMFNVIAEGLGFTNADIFKEVVFDSLMALANLIRSASDWVSRLLSGFESGNLLGNLENISLMFQELGVKAGEAFVNWMSSVDWGQLLINIGEVAIAVLVALGGFLNGWYSQILPALQSALMSILDTIQAGITGMVMSAGEYVIGFIDNVKNAVLNFVSSIGQKIGDAISSINIGEIVGNVKDWLVQQAKQATGQYSANSYDAQPLARPVYNYNLGTLSSPANSSYNQTNYITVTTGGTSQDIASAIVEALDRKWQEYRDSYNPIAV